MRERAWISHGFMVTSSNVTIQLADAVWSLTFMDSLHGDQLQLLPFKTPCTDLVLHSRTGSHSLVNMLNMLPQNIKSTTTDEVLVKGLTMLDYE